VIGTAVTELPLLVRELTPFEHSVMLLLCEGKTNVAIARETGHSEKVVENTVSRTAHAFNLHATPETNVRVILALAYRSHFGDKAFERFGVECQYAEIDEHGRRMCNRHV
jgi:DNA-binding NarL/FixJ family response regulator